MIILWICEPVPIPVGGRTAAVEEPLEGSDSRSILYYDTPDVAPMVARALSSGLRVAIHGIGDRAVTRALDLIEASSTAFVEELENSYLNNLGQERMNRAYPVRTFLDQGITAPSNSDFPVTTANPWFGIYACVTRTSVSGRVADTVQNITVAEALDAYTTEAAKASFEEDRLGRIAEGFLGDLVLLDRNPFDVPESELKDIVPEPTVCDGRIVHRGWV